MLINDVLKISWGARTGSGLTDRWYGVQACLESEEENSLELNTLSFYDNIQSAQLYKETDPEDSEVTYKSLLEAVNKVKKNVTSVKKIINHVKVLKEINPDSLKQIKQALVLLWRNFNSDLGVYLNPAIDQKLANQNLTKKEIEEIKDFYFSIKLKLDYQRQEVDLKKLALIYRQKFGNKMIDYSKLSKDFENLLTAHFNKYQPTFKQSWTGIQVDILDIYELLKQELKNPREINEKTAPKSLKKLTKQNKQFLELVNIHIYLDNYSSDLYTRIEFFLTKLIKEEFKTSASDLAWYSFDDLDRLIKEGTKLTDKQIRERKNYRVMIKINFEIGFFYGKDNFEKIKKILQFPNTINVDTTLIKGISACLGKVKGKVKIINSTKDIDKLKKGEVLVSVMTRPELMIALKKASAIVTDSGGITSHAAILSRELNIPCIVGTKIATQVLKDGDLVEVNADEGIVKVLNN